ncbi:hypothetical protein P7K49_031443 [Saguinus oedipus]|uniref:Uncharacterized protein n=1 Tax=Saguinus oedipus TaxID=9490 RepID=A0ABQ9U1B2_SAGOE|nr:hypothetical protein P7K49_031443 [Saguinus oedipus]
MLSQAENLGKLPGTWLAAGVHASCNQTSLVPESSGDHHRSQFNIKEQIIVRGARRHLKRQVDPLHSITLK